MKKLILFLSLFFSVAVFSQETAEIKQNDIVEKVDKMAEFPDGGIPSFRNEFAKNINTRKIKGKGVFRTEVRFIVERDGTISDIKATGENESFNEQAIKAVKKIKTKWNPGKLNGTSVRCRFRFPATASMD